MIDVQIPDAKDLEDDLTQPILGDPLLDHFADGFVSVSLKYYNKNCECFSDWRDKKLLKGFVSLLEKLSERTPEQVRANTNLCHAHKGPPPKKKRFSRPEDLSDDIQFYSLKVTDVARIHGFFVGAVFFLVWLDKGHECLPAH